MFIEEWADYKVCGICGRDNSWDDEDWPNDDICPNCEREEEIQRLWQDLKEERERE